MKLPMTKEPKDRLSDNLLSITPQTIRSDFPRRMVRGEYTIPAWTLYQALKLSPILASKASFWVSAVAGLDWTIHARNENDLTGVEKARMKKQVKHLRGVYERFDIKECIRYLAMSRFYGFSVLSRDGEKLAPLDWWSVLRDGMYGAWYFNPELSQTAAFGEYGLTRTEGLVRLSDVVARVSDCSLLSLCLWIFHQSEMCNNYWNTNLEQEARRQVIIIAGSGITDIEKFYDNALLASDGNSGALEGGGASGGPTTQVQFSPPSRAVPLFQERWKALDDMLTKALLGGVTGELGNWMQNETLRAVVGTEAAGISCTLQEQFDKAVLREAGLLGTNETPLAWFELTSRREVDPAQEVQWTAMLSSAGYRRDPMELAERVGFSLREIEDEKVSGTPSMQVVPNRAAAPVSEGARLLNRASVKTADKIREAAAVKRIGLWDKPVRDFFDGLAKRLGGDEPLDKDFLDKLEDALDNMPPDLADSEELAKFLEQAMAGAMAEKAGK